MGKGAHTSERKWRYFGRVRRLAAATRYAHPLSQVRPVCGSVLQCVVVCCSVLQNVAVCGRVWQCVVVRCNALQCAWLPQRGIRILFLRCVVCVAVGCSVL